MIVLMIYCFRESSTLSEMPSKSFAILEVEKVFSSFVVFTSFSSGMELIKALAATSLGLSS